MSKLSIKDIGVLRNTNEKYSVSELQWRKINAAYDSLLRIKESNVQTYGLHTGYGVNVTSKRDSSLFHSHQRDLLEYLQVGVGESFLESTTRLALRLQLYKVAQGYSGISPNTVRELEAHCNSDNIPEVPKYGSLGASGDLIPMAHAIAPVFLNNPWNASSVGPRDVIGLVNTNSFMSAYAFELFKRCEEILESTFELTAYSSLALCTREEPFHSRGLSANAFLNSYTDAGSTILLLRKKICKEMELSSCLVALSEAHPVPLQERYSVRCAPQILGNATRLLASAAERIEEECSAVADNPLVLPTVSSSPGLPVSPASPALPVSVVSPYFDGDANNDAEVWHGGHFYTAGLATAADNMLEIIARTTELADRQVLLLMHPSVSHGLPENLECEKMGHLKGIHQLLSALQQRIRALSLPSRLFSFSSESHNQDVLPCSMTALHNLNDALNVASDLLAGAHFAAQRAVFLRYGKTVPQCLALSEWKTFRKKVTV